MTQAIITDEALAELRSRIGVESKEPQPYIEQATKDAIRHWAHGIGDAKGTVESWNQGKRSPANLQPVLASLDKLDKIKRIPKKKIYSKHRGGELNG